MPDVSGPFDSSAYSQGSWYRDQGYLEPSGVQGTYQSTAAGGDLGWSSNGLTSSIALGRGHIRGAYYERTGTAFTYAHPANTTANPRIDTIVLRRDLAAKTVTPAVLQGTPAASPTAVALTQVDTGVWEEALFDVTVPANSGTVLTAVDRRQWIDPTSGQIDTGWRTVALNSPLTGSASYRKRGGIVDVHLDSSYSGQYNQNFVLFTLPAGFRPSVARRQVAMAYGGGPVYLYSPTSGDVAAAITQTVTGVWGDWTFIAA